MAIIPCFCLYERSTYVQFSSLYVPRILVTELRTSGTSVEVLYVFSRPSVGPFPLIAPLRITLRMYTRDCLLPTRHHSLQN
jgi:hypothetical protein